MSRQQKRADERRRGKRLLKICLAAGEGVSKAVAFSFALTSNAFAAEVKKRSQLPCRRSSCKTKITRMYRPNLHYRAFPCRCKTCRNRSLWCRSD